MTPLLAALSLGVALRLDLPEDAPTLGGLEADVRWAPVPGTVLGAAVGWGGGVNDTNPDRKLISQRFEGVALAGASLALGDGLALTLLGRAGIARLEGWPNGALTRISRFSPTVGAEAGARIDVTPTVALEPRVGLSWVRVAADDRFIPGAALAVHFTLGGSMSGWLPPDQVATTGWPVVGERGPGPDAPAAADWAFSVEGQVDAPATHRLVDLQAAPAELAMDVHCVTGWSHQAMRFTGQPLGPLLDAARPRPTARFVRFVAWSPRDHDTTLPLEDARAACWLAWAADGEPLAEVHGGPLRVVTTGRYFFKSLKWLRRIELLADDPLGFWERADGYHNHADPWPGDERYITGNLTGLALAKFMEATSFKRWHKGTIRRAPLAGWRPATRELGPLALKGCDLRGAHLAGARLAGANFSLSDLRGASLRGADLRGADLEGARLGGADLRGADLTGAALTAVAFDDATRVDGAVITGATGLLEGALAFLAARGLTPWI